MISGGMKIDVLTGNQVPSSAFKAHSDEYAAANACFSLSLRSRGTLKRREYKSLRKKTCVGI